MADSVGYGDKKGGDWTPVTGGISDPSPFLCDVPDFSGSPPDPLSQHIAALLALHPILREQLGTVNLAGMDEAAKRALLDDINRRLNIRPLRERGHESSQG